MLANSPYKLELFTAQSGFLSARLISDDGKVIHLHSIVKPENETCFFDSLTIWGDKIILLGTGLGYHIYNLLCSCQKDVLVIDYYQECVDKCVSLLSESSCNFQSISSLTSDAGTIVNDFLEDAENVQIIKHPASYMANKKFYDTVLGAKDLKSGTKDTIGKILILSGSFFLQEEIKNAAKSIGLDTCLFTINETDGILDYDSKLQAILQKEKPDVVISVNMLGFDSVGILGELTNKNGIPVVVWFVDDPRPILLHQKQFVKDNMFAFSWERNFLSFLNTCGFNKTEYLPLATDPLIFKSDGPVLSRAELGFVGSSMGRRFLQNIADKFLYRKELEPLVNSIARKLIADPACDLKREIHKACSNVYNDNRNETWFQSYIIHTASMLKRKMLIEKLIGSGIEIFGDPQGWRELLGKKIICHEDIDYRNSLASVYRGITININSTSCQMVTAVNQRVFDIPVCGSFVLTDNQSDLHNLFEKEEVAVYDTPEELIEKIKYFRENPEQRDLIVQKARTRILGEHTYSHRLRQIIEKI